MFSSSIILHISTIIFSLQNKWNQWKQLKYVSKNTMFSKQILRKLFFVKNQTYFQIQKTILSFLRIKQAQ